MLREVHASPDGAGGRRGVRKLPRVGATVDAAHVAGGCAPPMDAGEVPRLWTAPGAVYVPGGAVLASSPPPPTPIPIPCAPSHPSSSATPPTTNPPPCAYRAALSSA
jgi:hypothetical protein